MRIVIWTKSGGKGFSGAVVALGLAVFAAAAAVVGHHGPRIYRKVSDRIRARRSRRLPSPSSV